MNYKYYNNDNFADFSSGRVIYHNTGMPNFPVRLAGEIFCRCLEYIDRKDITLYDPCCGNAYMLTVLGLLNIHTIKTIIASDISEVSIESAKSNLALLSEAGLQRRKKQIEQMIMDMNKPSHYEALESVNRFLELVGRCDRQINTEVFYADILSPDTLKDGEIVVDIVIADVPYGKMAAWSDNNADAVNIMLENLLPVVSEKSVIAVITDKSQKITNGKYKRLEKFKVGTRVITILAVNNV